MYYLLNSSMELRQRIVKDNGAAQPNLSAQSVKNYVFPIPSTKKQERIVSILDRFDKLCNDISEGLPAEIEARQKQYEYYRDKLLSFSAK
ncbi:MAG: restriction endonuclease subunit S [Ruminococcus flavefaciens]|nr:restriction endonuclease subunit S [Ruminococcus flavefaciens]MCM1363145.1 restriction endonuclease subunit S [Clostridiales bacterium]